MMLGENWPALASCRNDDPDAMFVEGTEQNVAKRICRGCPVRYECLAEALDNRIEFGVWGGMTERERRAFLRRHPSVVSWRRVFDAAVERTVTDRAAETQTAAPPLGAAVMHAEAPPAPIEIKPAA
jgi:WhiB family transcriptional regulator, redox-sensing transcriptional regulator